MFTRLAFASELTKEQPDSQASESQIRVTTGSGGDYVFQPSTGGDFDGAVRVANAENGLFFANAGEAFRFEAFESVDNGPGPDAVHSGVLVSYDQPTTSVDLGEFSVRDLTIDTLSDDAPTAIALYTAGGELIASSELGSVAELLAGREYLLAVGSIESVFDDDAAFAGPGVAAFELRLNGEVRGAGVFSDDFATFTFTVTPALPGDYNDDGRVDAADFTLWRDSVGDPAGVLLNDADGGPIGAAQYATWAARYGDTIASDIVPEPGAAALIGAVAMSLSAVATRRRRRGV